MSPMLAPAGDAYNLTIAEIPATPLTLTINKPAGSVQNDVMIASIAVRPDTTIVITPPAGDADPSRRQHAGAVSELLAVYCRRRRRAGQLLLTFNTGNGQAGGIMSFTGVDLTDPVISTRPEHAGRLLPFRAERHDDNVQRHARDVALVCQRGGVHAAGRMTEVVDVSSVAPNNAVGRRWR